MTDMGDGTDADEWMNVSIRTANHKRQTLCLQNSKNKLLQAMSYTDLKKLRANSVDSDEADHHELPHLDLR